MDSSSFGASSVQAHWPYLGTTVAARSMVPLGPPGGRLTAGQLASLLAGTWGRAMIKMRDRAITLHLAHASPGRRAAAWNAYIASVIPYPAHYIPPSAALEASMASQLRVSLGMSAGCLLGQETRGGLGAVGASKDPLPQ